MVLAVQILSTHVREPGSITNRHGSNDRPRGLFPHSGRGHAIHSPISIEALTYTVVDKLSGQPRSQKSVWYKDSSLWPWSFGIRTPSFPKSVSSSAPNSVRLHAYIGFSLSHQLRKKFSRSRVRNHRNSLGHNAP